jgi:hypothetical protein
MVVEERLEDDNGKRLLVTETDDSGNLPYASECLSREKYDL